MAQKQLTSREVMGVLAAMRDSQGTRMVREYVQRLHTALDEKCDYEDMLGTEGWRRFLLGEDE